MTPDKQIKLTDEQIESIYLDHRDKLFNIPLIRACIAAHEAQRQAVQEPATQKTILEAAELFQQLDALLKPHGWPAQKILRNYVEMVKKVCIAAPQPAQVPLTDKDAEIAALKAERDALLAILNNSPTMPEDVA